MSNAMDKLKLIAEVRRRPALWDFQSEEHKSCLSLEEVWEDLAASVGSDADTCQNNWIMLCKVHRRTVKDIELRIKEDMLKGSYDPNKNYNSSWFYFEEMDFMKDIQSGPIKLRNSSDRLNLIAEVRKRPVLWDSQMKERKNGINVQKAWKELANANGLNVNECKRRWKILRMTYRKEYRKLQLRIEEDKFRGSYNANKDYSGTWVFYKHMKFIDENKKPSPTKVRNSSDNDNNSDDNDSNQFSKVHHMDNIEIGSDLELETEVYLINDEDSFSQEPADDKPTTSHQKSTKRSYEQEIILENPEKVEHNLIKSPRLDITQSKDDMVHVTDSDYNFLLSFMPQMKKINELQNLQFRAKITDLMLNIMS